MTTTAVTAPVAKIATFDRLGMGRLLIAARVYTPERTGAACEGATYGGG
jgi:hypothetical protein